MRQPPTTWWSMELMNSKTEIHPLKLDAKCTADQHDLIKQKSSITYFLIWCPYWGLLVFSEGDEATFEAFSNAALLEIFGQVWLEYSNKSSFAFTWTWRIAKWKHIYESATLSQILYESINMLEYKESILCVASELNAMFSYLSKLTGKLGDTNVCSRSWIQPHEGGVRAGSAFTCTKCISIDLSIYLPICVHVWMMYIYIYI